MIALQKLMKIYQMGDSTVHALDGVSLFIGQGEFVAITGPSGSGKSTLMNILGCLDRPTSGSYQLDGAEVATLSDDQLALTRNKKIGFVFQNFNLLPRISALHNIALPLVYAGVAEKERLDRSMTVLTKVGLAERSEHRPNELSGGQRQRIALARAMMLQPKVLVADEPTSALDVSIQAQVLNLFMDLQQEFNTAYVFISHNLAVVEHIADHVMVMYLGRVVESAPKEALFSRALHPYTQALLSATPSIDPAQRQKKIPITGELPSPLNPPSGCAFHKRCPRADARCSSELPLLREVEGRLVACHHV